MFIYRTGNSGDVKVTGNRGDWISENTGKFGKGKHTAATYEKGNVESGTQNWEHWEFGTMWPGKVENWTKRYQQY